MKLTAHSSGRAEVIKFDSGKDDSGDEAAAFWEALGGKVTPQSALEGALDPEQEAVRIDLRWSS